jgi:hypothetical protein
MSKDYRSQVFHVAEFGKSEAVYPDDYILVAIVDSEHVEKVFELTNHIDSMWWEVFSHCTQNLSFGQRAGLSML